LTVAPKATHLKHFSPLHQLELSLPRIASFHVLPPCHGLHGRLFFDYFILIFAAPYLAREESGGCMANKNIQLS